MYDSNFAVIFMLLIVLFSFFSSTYIFQSIVSTQDINHSQHRRAEQSWAIELNYLLHIPAVLVFTGYVIWASYLPPLCLSVVISKMGIIVPPS